MLRCLMTVAILLISLQLSAPAAAAAIDDLRAFISDYRLRTVFVEVRDPANPDNVQARGSGVLLKGGYVLTSLHLIGDVPADPDSLRIAGRVGFLEGVPDLKLHYVDHVKPHDLLLLRFNSDLGTDLGFACVRDEEPELGERLVILGFPLGEAFGVSPGVVTGLTANKINTTATVAQGNSGSPVFDENGGLIGIVRGELNSAVGLSDIYFVVPISRARNLVDQVEGRGGGCGSPAPASLLTRDGSATVVTVGPSGNIAGRRENTASLNNVASLDGRGGESSECDENSGRTISEVRARAGVTEFGQGGLQFDYTILAQGGHFRTADGCVFGEPVGLHGNDTAVSVEITARGEVGFTMPSGGPVRFRWMGFQPGTARLTVQGPSSQALSALIKELSDMQGSNEKILNLEPTSALEQYRLMVEVRDGATNNGACCPVSKDIRGRIEIERLS